MCIRDSPEQISTKFDSWVLALLAALTFAVATLGINVVANFVSAAFDISNVFPKRIDFKRGGYIAALIALVLYPFAPWEGGAAHFVNAIGATMGPLLGIILVDYYLVAKGRINVAALYDEHGEYRYQGGWNAVSYTHLVLRGLLLGLHLRLALRLGRGAAARGQVARQRGGGRGGQGQAQGQQAGYPFLAGQGRGAILVLVHDCREERKGGSALPPARAKGRRQLGT